jgi:hypothetical protein
MKYTNGEVYEKMITVQIIRAMEINTAGDIPSHL